MPGPSPDCRHPFNGEAHTVFLKNVISRPNIVIGDYTYYHDAEHAEAFEDRNVLYHFEFIGDQLIIGKFCALATGIQFIMNGANHAMTGFSTYPFHIFGESWQDGFEPDTIFSHLRGDTVVGHDVWFGRDSKVMPGIKIGSGAIIGAHTVVARDVPPYAIVAGNPGKVVKMRFPPETVETLLSLSWWGWPIEVISKNLGAIRGADLDLLFAIAEENT